MKGSFGFVLGQFIGGCFRGAFIGIGVFFVLYAALSRMGVGEAQDYSWTAALFCIPMWGVGRAWVALDYLKIQEEDRRYKEFMEKRRRISRGEDYPGDQP